MCVLCREGGLQVFREFVGISLFRALPAAARGLPGPCATSCATSALHRAALRRRLLLFFRAWPVLLSQLFEQLPRGAGQRSWISALPVTHLRCQGQSTDPAGMPRVRGCPAQGCCQGSVTPDRQHCVPEPGHCLLSIYLCF